MNSRKRKFGDERQCLSLRVTRAKDCRGKPAAVPACAILERGLVPESLPGRP